MAVWTFLLIWPFNPFPVFEPTIFLKYCQIWPLLCLFSSFLNTMTNIGSTKFNFVSIDGVVGIQTLDCNVVCADESIEQCRPSPRTRNFKTYSLGWANVMGYMLLNWAVYKMIVHKMPEKPLYQVSQSVWPGKNCQMCIKVAQKWFH